MELPRRLPSTRAGAEDDDVYSGRFSKWCSIKHTSSLPPPRKFLPIKATIPVSRFQRACSLPASSCRQNLGQMESKSESHEYMQQVN